MCKDTPFPDNNQEKQRKKKKIPILFFYGPDGDFIVKRGRWRCGEMSMNNVDNKYKSANMPNSLHTP